VIIDLGDKLISRSSLPPRVVRALSRAIATDEVGKEAPTNDSLPFQDGLQVGLPRPPLSPAPRPRHAASLRIASAAACSFRVARDRRFETSSSTSSSVAFSCSRARGRASGRRSGRNVQAVSARPVPSTRGLQRSLRGRSRAPLPRQGRGCHVRVPAGRSLEGGPVRSTFLLPGAETASRV